MSFPFLSFFPPFCKLLARLEGRSSLKEIEPHLFADEESPVHGKSSLRPKYSVINYIL